MESNGALSSNVVVQVGIVVRDIDRAREVFSKVLGVPVPDVIETAGQETAHTVYRGQPTDARAKLAFFHTGTCAIELIEPIGGPSTWREQLENHGNSIHHIAFQIRGMDGAIRSLEALGAETVQRGDYTGGRYAYVDMTDAVGAVLELLEND
ncbi:MAG: VOC family protein [Armatimonadetes bacterium]|nr:VOC family protein [Armatimonadota bacterium]